MSPPVQEFTLEIQPPDPATQDSHADIPLGLGFGLAIAILVATALESRSRLGVAADGSAPPRLVRIALTAALLASAVTLLLVVEMVVRPGAADELLPTALVALAALMLFFLIVVAVLDFWLGLFAPRRTWKWLGLAVGTFVLLIAAALGVAFWRSGTLDNRPHSESLQLLVLAAAAGIMWWSRLPPPAARVERRFE